MSTDVVSIFRRQVAATPDRCAVRCGESTLTYSELDRRARGTENWLRSHGARAEAPVAILMDRGPAAVAAMVGAAGSGCAYVPLDPASPPSRLALIFDECGIGFALVDTPERAEFVRRECGPAVEVAVVADLASGSPGPARPSPVPAQLLYIIYTSGSTGSPKGVAIEHRDLAAFAEDPCWDGLTDRVLHYSPLFFDASVFEIWVPLLRGGCAVVAPGGPLDAADVGHLLEQESITCAFLTTSLFNVLVDEYPAGLARIRQLWTGGEAASPAAVSRALRQCGPGRVVNVYGPTEATIFATFHVVGEDERAPVPIGSAMAQVRTSVVDATFVEVRPGQEGELCLGGTGVARGYVGRPGLTADRFVPDPVAGGGARMYRTGDVVRARADGLLEFVGRRDEQVKVRGFRIELGEIEAHLRERSDVADARVLAPTDRRGDRSLVAYVVARRDAPQDRESWSLALLDHLREHVPSYMVPPTCVVLDRLPLTANGKLDSRALPAVERPIRGRSPRSAAEGLLCDIFADVLGLPDLGSDDDFFALGGHSLSAARVVARVEQVFQVRPAVSVLFEASTPALLALRLSSAEPAADRGGVPVLIAGGRTGVQPLSDVQYRLWLLATIDGAENPKYHMSMLFRIPDDVDIGALAAALRDTVSRHDSLRTAFRVRGTEPEQIVLSPGERELRLPVLMCAPGAFDETVRRFSRTPFALADGMPIRAAVIRTTARTELLVVMHHIVADGWSLTPFARDVSHAYHSRAAGRTPSFDPLPVTYLDYSAWRRGLLGVRGDPDSLLAQQLEFWAQQLTGAPVEVTPPADRPRPEVSSDLGALLEFTVAPPLRSRLEDLARSTHTTLFMVVQAGLAALLTRLGAGTDIVVGSPVAGRPDPALDEVVGFFVNTVVLRTDTSGDPAFDALLARVRAGCLAAYAHQDVPFDLVVERVNPMRSASRHPLFQVSLGLLNTTAAVMDLGGSPGRWRPVDTGAAKFDLAVTLIERHSGDEPGALEGSVEYATDLFDRDTVLRLVNRWLVLLEDACAYPGRRVSELAVMAADELSALLPRAAIGAATRPPTVGLPAARLARTMSTAGDLVLVATGGGTDTGTACAAVLGAGRAVLPFADVTPELVALALTRQVRTALIHDDVPAGDVEMLRSHGIETVTISAAVRASDRFDPIAVLASDPEALACVLVERGPDGAPVGLDLPFRALPAAVPLFEALRPLYGDSGTEAGSSLVRLVDPGGGIAGFGMVGELCLAGPALPRDLTGAASAAARFVPDPWGPSGSRMYRTGLMMRRLSDGLVALAPHPVAVVAAPTSTSSEAGSWPARLLRDVFTQVLGVEQIGDDDDFFQFGGHSQLALRLVGLLRAEHGVEITLRDLFRAPTVAGLAPLLDRRPAAPDTVTATTDPGVPVVLSAAQQRLWFLDQLWPGRCDYNVPMVRRMDGCLDTAALTAAITALVRRHDSLRTRYELVGDEPRQIVEPPTTPPMLVVDCSGMPADHARSTADRVLIDAAMRPFDLSAAPPLHVVLVKLADAEHLLAIMTHHIATDGASNELLWRELAVLYREYRDGVGTSTLPELPLRYADFAAWQHERHDRAELDEVLEYWRNRLAGAPPTELPADRPRPARWSGRGAQLGFEIPTGPAARMRELARHSGATPFTTLLAVFDLLVAESGEQGQVAVGTSVSGRSRPELGPLVGFFVDTVVLRSVVDPVRSFRELLADVTADAAAAFSHARLPFDRIVGDLNQHRDLSRNPLFQLMFDLSYADDRAEDAEDWGALTTRVHPVPFHGAKVDLEIVLVDDGDVVSGDVYYATDLFDGDTVHRLLRRYRTLLDAVVDEPDTPVGELGRPRDEGAGAWNDTAADVDVAHGLHELVSRQATRTPDAVAVVHRDDRLTYRQLDMLSDQMAHRLIASGVRRGDPVGLMVDRSPELVVALLGVLKAGGAFVPLDPDLPPARVQQLMDSCRAGVCVTQVDLNGLAVFPPTPPGVTVFPDDLVSLYFTSGSTGEPKAVANTHRGWANRMWWMHRQHGLDVGERVLHKTVLSFDDSAVELFWPLMVGGTVVVLDPGAHRDARAILQAVVAHEVAVVQFVPSMLALFLDEIEDSARPVPSGLRDVISSGETLPPALVGRFETLLGDGCRLHNQWGPTEVSIDATLHTCDERDPGRDSVPIGLPIANCQVHVLDQWQRPVRQGQEGELHIGGVGLARGYWDDPRRTAEAFVPDPFGRGTRLYRTGDRGIRATDGSLWFRGRADHQIKIRGVRIEPAEIERALTGHPAVDQALVRTWEPVAGEQVLVGYVVSRPGASADADALRCHLGERLPPYMVPTEFVVIDEMPRTSSGKLDLKRLPAPTGRADGLPGRPPQTDGELLVAQVWAEFLTVDGIDDDFFARGGHSLLAGRLMARLRRALDVELPLVLIFENPTIATLAAAVERELVATVEPGGSR